MIKRLLDILLVLLTLPIWLPVIFVVWLLVFLSMGSPVFFKQKRAGLKGHPFSIIKFRSMTDARDPAGELLPDGDRLTSTGRLLRRFSLDELPGLLNVLKGEMSLVGPRPLPLAYIPRYSREQSKRLNCLPGITGWAQVNGRNRLDWEERFEHDLWYVENQSILLDIRILLMTLLPVLRGEGVSADNVATMTEFKGNQRVPDQGHPDVSQRPDSPDPSRKT